MENTVAEQFGTFGNQVKWLLNLSCRRFAAIRRKFYCKSPFKKL